MKICAAQIFPFKGDVEKNIELHRRWINTAALHGTDFIVFPELSLTGYEPELADTLAMRYDDSRLAIFQTLSNEYNMVVAIGVPIRSDSGVHIGMGIFQPNEKRLVYFKQQLHEDEYPYFVPGELSVTITRNSEKIVPAICYESLLNSHAENAAQQGADLYMASVAKSENGIKKALQHYPQVARKHNMAVLMVNNIGPNDTFVSVGKSAVWNKNGTLLAQLNETDEGILVFDTQTEETFTLQNPHL